MRARTVSHEFDDAIMRQREMSDSENSVFTRTAVNDKQILRKLSVNYKAEILVITTYPPQECGIAAYSQDLITSLNNKFSNSLSTKVCALETGDTNYSYPGAVKYVLNTSLEDEYENLVIKINHNHHIKIVLIQHEFGFFRGHEQAFLKFLYELSKPFVIVFHTVLPHPDVQLKSQIRSIGFICSSIIVMTHESADILTDDYNVPRQKISVIAHGTHLVPHLSKEILKRKYGLAGRKVLSTLGLPSSGKGIETTLEALPAIVKKIPDVLFLVIGKTHPEVAKDEGEKYWEMLEQKVKYHAMQDHVIFINNYLALQDILEYLQLSDICLFTANDPNQAVSATFAYAMSCGCPIISAPIPHAKELLTEDTGIIFDFHNSKLLADGVIRLLKDEPLRKSISFNALQKIIYTAWENSALAHAKLFEEIIGEKIIFKYDLPEINLDHVKKMTTNIGIIQLSKINQPDPETGYTLDENARAMIVMCMHFKLTGDAENLKDVRIYLKFIKRCLQPAGNFLNYVDKKNEFTPQNQATNLDDSNGRAIWALGYLLSLKNILPAEISTEAEIILKRSLHHLDTVYSIRAMGFALKGLFYYNSSTKSLENLLLVKRIADRLVQMFRHESNEKWKWFETYLTYENSILPEALVYAWLLTGDPTYKDVAKSSLDFLLSQTFNDKGIEVISNKNWLKKGPQAGLFGEQPIDVAYTVLTLSKFYEVFEDDGYRLKMETAFNWFLGKNRLHQIIYNPCTGGCYDGLEETQVNLNQGAESTLSYLMARLTMEKYKSPDKQFLI